MKILFFYHKPIIEREGGVEKVTTVLSQKFSEKGHSVYYAYYCGKSQYNFENALGPFRIIEPQDSDSKHKFEDFINSQNIEIIINQSWSNEVAPFLKSLNLHSAKIISNHHNQPFSFYKKERIYKKLEQSPTFKAAIAKYVTYLFPHLYRHLIVKRDGLEFKNLTDASDKVMLLSEKFISRVLKLIPDIDKDKIDYMNNPNPYNIDPNISFDKENLVIFVARLVDPQKNVRAFIDVWNLFYNLNPSWHALIIGDGPQKELFENYAKKQNTRNLKFLGNVPEVSPYYKTAKFLCVTSLYEGWGMIIAEAASYGCIPFAFNTYEALSDLITNGKTGFIFPNLDVYSMAREMNQIAHDPEEFEKISNQMRNDIQKYDADIIADKWISKFHDLLKGCSHD